MLGAILLLLFVLAPRLELLAVGVVLLLGWGTVAASARVDTATDDAQVALVGEPRDWIDRNVSSDVAYVYNGDLAAWTVVWEQRFWNPRIDRVISIIPHFVPGPIPQRVIALPRDGRLPIDERYAVANDQVQFEGSPIAQQDRGPNQYGLTLWKLQRPARLSSLIAGPDPERRHHGTRRRQRVQLRRRDAAAHAAAEGDEQARDRPRRASRDASSTSAGAPSGTARSTCRRRTARLRARSRSGPTGCSDRR